MKRYLLSVMLMVGVAIGASASINVWSTHINGVNGYGIYDWSNAGELSQFLNGTYTGTVYNAGNKDDNWTTDLLPNILEAGALKFGGSAEAPKEMVNTEDLKALSLVKKAKYVRMDLSTPAEDTDFTQIAIGSPDLIDITLPSGVTKKQVEQANEALMKTATGLQLTVGIAGTVTTSTVTHYWYTLNGATFEYTGEVSPGQTSVTLDNEKVMVTLSNAEGYPKAYYTNTKNRNEQVTMTAEQLESVVNGKYTPASFNVALTEKDNPTYQCTYEGKTYDINSYEVTDGKLNQDHYLGYYDGANHNIPQGTEVDVIHHYSYSYTFWNGNYDGPEYNFEGEILGNKDDGYYGVVNNTDDKHYQFDVTTTYKYTYTDLNGVEHVTDETTTPDGDMLTEVYYTGTLDLTSTEEQVRSMSVDGMVAHVNTAGALKHASDYMFTNNQKLAYLSSKNVTIIGDVNSTDISQLYITNFNDAYLIDLSDANVTLDADKTLYDELAEKNKNNGNRHAQVIILPTVANRPIDDADVKKWQGNYNGVQTIAYYTDATKKNLAYWSGNGGDHLTDFAHVTPLLGPDMTLSFIRWHDGSFPETPGSELIAAVGDKEIGEIDFSNINISKLLQSSGKDINPDFSGIKKTHYILLPINNNQAAYDFTKETANGGNWKYNDNIWVVGSTFTKTGRKSYYLDGLAVDPVSESTNITYIRKANTLDGAAKFLNPEQKSSERFIVCGTVGDKDLSVMGDVRSIYVDMSTATLVSGASVKSYKSNYVKYLAFPGTTVATDFVPSAVKANCPALLAVGFFNEATTDVEATKDVLMNNKLYYASWQEGSAHIIRAMMPEAGNSGKPGVKAYKMWGPLTASDIANGDCANINAEGHFESGANNLTIYGLPGTSTQILSADLSMAWFPVQDDMCFNQLSAYGASTFELCELPRTHMTIIPALAFQNSTARTWIAIPDIYTTIKTDAFDLNEAMLRVDVHDIVTEGETDLDGVTFGTTGHTTPYDYISDNALIKEKISNGDHTITLPASLGSAEGEGLYSGAFNFRLNYITDVYVMATTAPRCAQNAFGSVAYYGNNTFGGVQSHPFARDKYRMDVGSKTVDEEDKWITVLHFPVECTASERANYTDITRDYSLADETGQVDGEGKPIMWPSQSEMNRSYYQAIAGATWAAWKDERDPQNEIYYEVKEEREESNPSFDEAYTGWHQFILAANWMYIPEEQEGGTTDYTQTDWYTFCIPFDMTKKQVVELLGVPASTEKFTRTLNNVKVDADVMPDVRTLVGVTRYPSTQILLHLSQNIAKKDNDIHVGLRQSDYTATRAYAKDESGNEIQDDDHKVYIKGGFPYLVKAYVPTELKDKVKNLGGFVLARGEFFQTNVGNKYTTASDGALQAPYELRVQAESIENKGTAQEKRYFIQKDGTEDKQAEGANADAYIYTFVGQYWEQPLPLYSYYLGTSKNGKTFFRATAAAEGSTQYSKWTWNPYVAIITAKGSTEVTQPQKASDGSYTQSLSMKFAANDDSFAAGAKFAFVFDDGIDELEGDNDVTSVRTIEGVVTVPVKTRVYSLNGQYCGESLVGLPKGLYIVNGKKYVVK